MNQTPGARPRTPLPYGPCSEEKRQKYQFSSPGILHSVDRSGYYQDVNPWSPTIIGQIHAKKNVDT